MDDFAATPIVLVLAVSENGVIGKNNGLPWHLPDDLRHFKRTTLGRPVVMGRKTFESVGKPLPGRTNIVLTQRVSWSFPGVEAFQNLDKALDRGRQQALLDGADSVCVVGGAEIYRLCLAVADRIVLTLVHGDVTGDAYFDLSSISDWREVKRAFTAAGEFNSHGFTVVELER